MDCQSTLHYIFIVGLFILPCMAAENVPAGADKVERPPQLELVRSIMCEQIEDYSPVNIAVVFSVTVGKISCFTSFDPVPTETQIEHKWYHKDTLSTQKRLFLKPPRWSTFSSIQLRETDKGPWRVEIVDNHHRILGILRFSVTD